MKRIILFCLAAALCAQARPSLQVDRERVESGKNFGLQLVFPLNELPENRSELQIETANGFTLVGIDSTDQVIRPDIEDMFNSFFGGGGGFSGFDDEGPHSRGTNIRVRVKVSLQDIANGVEKHIKIKKYVECEHCHGTGAKDGTAYETCGKCKGRGRVIQTVNSLFGRMQTESVCPDCHGTGKKIKTRCSHCNGQGVVMGEEVIDVKIPAGVAEGMQLSMSGYGNAAPNGGRPGDLFILIDEEKQEKFIRADNNLIYNLLLDFPTAALGGEVEVPLVEGTEKVKIPAGTQPNTQIRLAGKGLPTVNRYGKGDIIINISVYVPESLDNDEKKIIESLRDRKNFGANKSAFEKFINKIKNSFS